MNTEEAMLRYVLSFIVLLFIGCTAQPDKEETSEVSTEITAPYVEDEKLYWEAARKLTASYAGKLRTELTEALANGDAANALGVCSERAPEIAVAFSQSGWSIKRVSDRNRNPDNRADFSESVVLATFDDQAPDPHIETWIESDSTAVYMYYEPIHTSPICLKCHGDMQTLGTGVYRTLKRLYPLDKATGYKTGELRGMFVVEANWPEGKEYAKRVIIDSL